MVKEREINMKHGRMDECVKHKRSRQYKVKQSKPTTKCLTCWLVYLSDRLETSLYESDVKDLILFSNTFDKVIKPTSLEYIETKKEEE